VPVFGKKRIDEITRLQISNLLLDIASEKKTTAHRVRAYLSGLFNWAIEVGLIETSPMPTGREGGKRGNRMLGTLEPRERVLTGDELRTVLNTIPELGLPFAQFYRFLTLTGQRVQECAGIRWDEIDGLDTDAPVWTIPATRYKTKQDKRFPLSQAAADVLREMRQHRPAGFEHVFVTGLGKNPDTPISGFSKVKARLDRLSGVDGWVRFHARRRIGGAVVLGEAFVKLKIANSV